MRTGKLLKRLIATPMKKSHLFLAFMSSRLVLTLVEIGFFLGFARLIFGVHVFGSHLAVFVFGIIGSFAFGGLGF
jgi:ABC-type multidrug transport system permease subunit